MRKKLSSVRGYLIASGCVIVCAVFAYLFASFCFFPGEIKMLQGANNFFDFKLPIQAVIEAENVAVVNVNNEPVENNINVDLTKPLSIQTQEGMVSLNMKLNIFGIPIKTVKLETLPARELVPCGMAVGLRINTEGVMVLGTGYVNAKDGTVVQPSENILKSGDLILSANGVELANKEGLIQVIEDSTEIINMEVKREEEILSLSIVPVVAMEDDKNKIGVWVRDSTQGIGTITYYDPENGSFAALGHGILDVDTKMLMSVKSGEIMASEVVDVKKGKKGTPGELIGEINKEKILGAIDRNTSYGIFGTMNEEGTEFLGGEKREIALQGDVHEGPAYVLSNVSGTKIEKYDVYIETINRYSSDDSKGMVLRILDPKLLEATSGIVQGMSGSPIIQDEKLIGALTHVFVQEPSKGYGIFIENMLK